MQSRIYVKVTTPPSKTVRYVHYLSYLLFEKYGEKENAAICLDRAKCTKTAGIDFPDQVVQARTAGWKLKESKEMEKAKATFATAASEGDPISQYELALLLGFANPQTEELLKAAAPHLIQAKAALYQLYVGKSDYDNGYKALYDLVEFSVRMILFFKTEMHINAFPSLHKIVQRSNEINYCVVSHRTLPKVLGECALVMQDKKDSLELHNLAASQGNAESIIFLATYNQEELLQRRKECTTLQAMILAGKNGDAKLTEQLIQQARVADTNTLIALFEQVYSSKEIYHIKDDYSFKIVEAASNSHPITSCLLSIMCYHAIGAKQDMKKSQDILKQVQLDVTKFAEGGNIMAQWELGWIAKENWRGYYESLKWLSKSAPHMLLALHTLGDSYLKGYYDGMRGRNYPAEARLCYEKCAEFGYAQSQIRLEHLGEIKGNKKNVEETKTNVQTKACYEVVYDNPMLNVPNFVELAQIARREALVLSHDNAAMNGVNKLLDVGANPHEWSTFKFLQEVAGDTTAVRWALQHEQKHCLVRDGDVQVQRVSDVSKLDDQFYNENTTFTKHHTKFSTTHSIDHVFRNEGGEIADAKLLSQLEWSCRTGEVLPTLQRAIEYGIVQLYSPNSLITGLDRLPEQITLEQRIDELQEACMPLVLDLPKNLRGMLLDQKVHAQAEWYYQTGEALPTLQAVMRHEGMVPPLMELTQSSGTLHYGKTATIDAYEDASSFWGYVASLLVVQYMTHTTELDNWHN